MTTITPTKPTPPSLSLQQRLSALAKANTTRSRRKVLKQDIKRRRNSPAAILEDPPEWAQTMTVFDLLLAVPRVGRVKANKMLCRTRIAPSKTLGGMTVRQRTELSALLQAPASTGPEAE